MGRAGPLRGGTGRVQSPPTRIQRAGGSPRRSGNQARRYPVTRHEPSPDLRTNLFDRGDCMKKKRRLLWWGIAALVLVAGIGAMFAARSRGTKDLEVQTATASRQRIVQTVNGTGKIQPQTQVKISADVSARITRLAVKEGQWVEKGALLVTLDRDRYLAAVESAEASVRSAQANATLTNQNMENTQREYERSKALLARGMEAQAAYDAK